MNEPSIQADALIAGGGVAGLSCAAALAGTALGALAAEAVAAALGRPLSLAKPVPETSGLMALLRGFR